MSYPDWWSPDAKHHYRDHDRADFAQEFLRRNRVFVADQERLATSVKAGLITPETAQAQLASRWGVFGLDPSASPKESPAFWASAALPVLVQLLPAVTGSAVQGASAAGALSAVLARAQAGFEETDSYQLVIADRQGAHRVRIPKGVPVDALGGVVLFDAAAPLRLDAVARLMRAVRGRPAGLPPRGWRLTEGQQRLLALRLQALDGRAAGHGYRDVAGHLLDRSVTALTAREWNASSVKATIYRLAATGAALRDGGYRRLLAGA